MVAVNHRGKDPPMLRGLTTVTYTADDVTAAVAWYTEVFGIAPYFVREAEGSPAYVEFRIGDYQHEFGILDRRFRPDARPGEPGGVLTYWAVDDVEASFERLLSLGATVHEKPIERGPGYVTASVIDPFGNLLGVMYNVHYLEVLGS
jgi:predicted enzyme related to lactoylglutathione lyase